MGIGVMEKDMLLILYLLVCIWSAFNASCTGEVLRFQITISTLRVWARSLKRATVTLRITSRGRWRCLKEGFVANAWPRPSLMGGRTIDDKMERLLLRSLVDAHQNKVPHILSSPFWCPWWNDCQWDQWACTSAAFLWTRKIVSDHPWQRESGLTSDCGTNCLEWWKVRHSDHLQERKVIFL